MVRNGTLSARVAEDLRSELAAGNYAPGVRLPTETELSGRFGVSRPTVRAALKELETLGLVHTQHGVGTFVAEQPAIRAGLERMDSITDSIRATGREPGMVYVSRIVRAVLPEEAAQMDVPGDTEVLEVRRTILADGEVVAYSYDLMPLEIFPAGFDPGELTGSIFSFLRSHGIHPNYGIAEVHAVHSTHVGWGNPVGANQLYVLLNQRHFDATDRLLQYSRTYFIEGRYSFTIIRRI